jgi:hypothetical protein
MNFMCNLVILGLGILAGYLGAKHPAAALVVGLSALALAVEFSE